MPNSFRHSQHNGQPYYNDAAAKIYGVDSVHPALFKEFHVCYLI